MEKSNRWKNIVKCDYNRLSLTTYNFIEVRIYLERGYLFGWFQEFFRRYVFHFLVQCEELETILVTPLGSYIV